MSILKCNKCNYSLSMTNPPINCPLCGNNFIQEKILENKKYKRNPDELLCDDNYKLKIYRDIIKDKVATWIIGGPSEKEFENVLKTKNKINKSLRN